MATSILCGDNRQYTARPFLISGTCKREDVAKHTTLLELAIRCFKQSPSVPTSLRLYCVASDGDSKRRRALVNITFTAPLNSASPIYTLLAPLHLFNLICGPDDLTADFDYKHIGKHCRNTLTRKKGLQINGVSVNTSLIKLHLVAAGMHPTSADVLLSPNDKQDVTLMYRLLLSLSQLPNPADDASPTFSATR